MKKSIKNKYRYFTIGERIYNCDYQNTTLMGFGTITNINGKEKDGFIMGGDFAVIKLENGETITANGENIYKIAPRVSKRCGEIVCYEHNETEYNYPYYMPSNDENYFAFELK